MTHDSPDKKPSDRPQLRLTGGVGEPDPPDAADAPFLATRLGVLTHELAGLLDGSLRCIGMARRSLQAPAGSGGDPSVEQQLQTVHAALERMAGLVHNAMQGSGSTIGTSVTPNERSVSLAEAVEHAVSVISPLAREHRVELSCTVGAEAGECEAGPVYAVILNGLRNAIEAVASAGNGGTVELRLGPEESRPDWMALTIADDGPGLAPACEDGRAFIIGLTTKPAGSGIGLCLSAQVVGQLGGRISLETREPASEEGRRGAVLRASWPAARPESPGTIG